jgi:hypothetical protein
MKHLTTITVGFLVCAAAALFLGLGCGKLSVVGGGTEDINAKTVAGVITYSNGKPAPQTTVRLFHSRYNPVTDSLFAYAFIDTTDEKGAYRFGKLDTGTYSLQAVQNRDRTRLLIENIRVSSDSFSSLSAAELQKPGSIKILLPVNADPQGGYVFIPGTDIKSFVYNKSGFAQIDSVPAGNVSALYYGARNTAPYGICSNITVLSGDGATFSSGPWAHSMKLILNTSASGANITGNVLGFPVLVRLAQSASAFDFSQAQSGGSDLRFIKSDNSLLNYEIENWDSVHGQAAVWVNVDTILGNNATQSITMCWGNALATAANSSGAAVFDTADKFSGVWHLNENPAQGQNSVLDRTVNKFNASPNGGMNAANSVDGIIGKALHFNGIGEYLIIKRPVQDDFTIGFWMKADSLSPMGTQWWQGDGLVDGDVNASEPQDDFGVTYLNNKPVFGTCCADTTLQASSAVNDAKWHYVAVTRNRLSGLKTIFVDGKSAGVQTGTTNSLTGPDSLCFAKVLANVTYFKGFLDEIQISDVARSSDWTQLCYMNQKQQDALVIFQSSLPKSR